MLTCEATCLCQLEAGHGCPWHGRTCLSVKILNGAAGRNSRYGLESYTHVLQELRRRFFAANDSSRDRLGLAFLATSAERHDIVVVGLRLADAWCSSNLFRRQHKIVILLAHLTRLLLLLLQGSRVVRSDRICRMLTVLLLGFLIWDHVTAQMGLRVGFAN